MKRAVFLDRDGTMVQDAGYLDRRENLRWFPWTIDAIRLLNRAGYLVCVTTNQGGIGKGLYPEAFVQETHREMAETLTRSGGRVDGWYYCPHHPQAVIESLRLDCACRKPKAGMVEQAVRDLAIDPRRSFVVGDKFADLGMGKAAGAVSILVRTGEGASELARHGGEAPDAACVAADLMEATSWILGEGRARVGE